MLQMTALDGFSMSTESRNALQPVSNKFVHKTLKQGILA